MSDRAKENRRSSSILRWVVLIGVALGVIFGFNYYNSAKASQAKHSTAVAKRLPVVYTEPVVKTDMSYKNNYVGRVVPIQSVQLKAQVAGEITKVNFKEGSTVRAGQVLFEIDDRQYKATVKLRKAELERAKAAQLRSEKYLARLKSADKRSVSASDMELAESNALQGMAAVSEADAALKLAEINLGFTKVKSPITGKIGAALLTKGNYVSPASGALATIVQMNPIRVSFNMPDRDYIDQISEFNKKGSVYETELILSNGEQLKAKGKRDFENNRVDEKTGTMMVRVRVNNENGKLVPGSMVRVMTSAVKRMPTLLVPQTAISGDSNGDFVYVAHDGVVTIRRVVTGTEYGLQCEIKEGLSEGESVVVRGIQGIRDGMKVDVRKEKDSQHSKIIMSNGTRG